ncbi:MAG: rod shape-determining protein MreC [Proteobacteria bacterium]|nr:rod shape-determining protein MreC [Pseudomonadota bacterium]
MRNRILGKKYKEIIILLVVILVIITVNAGHRVEHKLRWYDKAIVLITAPVQYVFTSVIKGTVRLVEDYFFLVNVKEDNQYIIRENAVLKNRIHQLTESEYENSRLKKLLLLRERLAIPMISAEVVSKDSSSIFKTIRINKGENNGIKISMPVINYDGVVGQIIRVFGDYSDVLLITDPNSDIDAMVQEDRARGVIEGLAKNECRLKYLERLDDVRKGDVILTSGLEKRFPKGIIIGQVQDVRKKKFGITQEVIIKPSVDFNRIEEVFVVVISQ